MDQQLIYFFIAALNFFTKNLESLFNTVLGQDGIICNGVGLWSGFTKCGNSIADVGIGFCNNMEGTGTNNWVAPAYGAPIGSNIIVVDGGRIT